ncbi:hypothetical protein RJ641_000827 [Dillenia turbinata]|uniref:protein-tyrosine-phosphatase n=1 Tax=Dillenia turbinata TaxID=194707 RepID=A0AAN8ZMP8_9MAGN
MMIDAFDKRNTDCLHGFLRNGVSMDNYKLQMLLVESPTMLKVYSIETSDMGATGLVHVVHLLHLSVYNSWEAGKFQCFTWIKERYGRQNVMFCVVGDGWEECEAVQSMRYTHELKADVDEQNLLSKTSETARGLSAATIVESTLGLMPSQPPSNPYLVQGNATSNWGR